MHVGVCVMVLVLVPEGPGGDGAGAAGLSAGSFSAVDFSRRWDVCEAPLMCVCAQLGVNLSRVCVAGDLHRAAAVLSSLVDFWTQQSERDALSVPGRLRLIQSLCEHVCLTLKDCLFETMPHFLHLHTFIPFTSLMCN